VHPRVCTCARPRRRCRGTMMAPKSSDVGGAERCEQLHRLKVRCDGRQLVLRRVRPAHQGPSDPRAYLPGSESINTETRTSTRTRIHCSPLCAACAACRGVQLQTARAWRTTGIRPWALPTRAHDSAANGTDHRALRLAATDCSAHAPCSALSGWHVQLPALGTYGILQRR
jgi:hypothetical protein